MASRVRSGIAAILIGLAFAAVGAYFVVPHVQTVDAAEPVDAVVLSSDVTHNSEGPGYFPEVTYRYTHDGTEYTSETVFPGGARRTTEDRAREITSEYQAGTEVTAHVVPENPDRSFLIETDMPWWYYLGPGVGGLFVLLGLHNVIQGIRGVEVPG